MCVTLCMVALGAALVGYASHTARQEALAKARLQLLTTAQQQAEALQKPLDTAMVAVRTLAQALGEDRSGAHRLDRNQVSSMLRRILKGNHEFLAVYTMWEPDCFDGMDARNKHQPGSDASGRFVPYWNRDRSGLLRLEPITGFEAPGHRDFYLLARTTGREMVVEPYSYSVQGKPVLMTSAIAPVLAQNHFLGIAGIEFRADFLQNLADAVNVYHRSGQLTLMTPSGRIAAMTDNSKAIGQNFSAPAALEETARRAATAASRTADLGGRLYAFQPIQISHTLQPWWVILSVPETVVLKEPNQTIRTMILTGIVIMALGVILLLFVIKKLFVERVTRLNRTTKAFGAGNYEVACTSTGADEIGQLAGSFNTMAGRIRATLTELVEKDLLLTAVLDNAFQMYGLLDLEGGVLSVNKSTLVLIDRPLASLVGRPVWELPLWSLGPEEQAQVRQAVADARAGQFCRFETTVMDRAQTLHYVDFSITPLADERGTVHRLILEGRDITEHREDQHRQISLMEQLHHSQKMDALGKLAGGVAHDFNNFITGILGACQILREGGEDQAVRNRYTEMIETAGMRAATLTSKLLHFAHRRSKVAEAVSLARIVADTLVILERTINKNIHITFRNEAASDVIMGDDSQIQNMLLNLAINASHAMPTGGNLELCLGGQILDQEACAALDPHLQPGAFLTLEVRDDGCGMAPETTRRIFEPFFTTKGPGKGTGLGLAEVFSTVKNHQGAITVVSELGRGTVFRIYLPAAAGAPVEPGVKPGLVAGSGVILLVDDEEVIRATLKAVLESLGYRVLLAENGREGVETFRRLQDQIQLVILDMIMPDMGGSETFAEIRAIRPDAKVIVASGYCPEEDLKALQRDGLVAFIQKPCRVHELTQLIKEVLKGQLVAMI